MPDLPRKLPRGLAALGTKGRLYHLAAAFLLSLFCALAARSAQHDSPTIDEPVHLTRGLAVWWTGDTRLSYLHPPLGNALAALPAALLGPRVDLRALPGWAQSDAFRVAEAFVRTHYDEVTRLIAVSRRAIIALAALLGLYIYAWCFRRYGPFTALAALFFYCLNPTVLAHARLMTTDVPVAVFSVIAVGELVSYLERPRVTPLLTMGLALGAALSTKYLAIFLVPVMLLAAGTLAVLGRGRFAGMSPARRLGQLAEHALLTMLVAVFCVNAAYRFQRTGWTVARTLAEPEPLAGQIKKFKGSLLELRTPLQKLPGWLPLPLPYTYVFGVATVNVQDDQASQSYYLGETTTGHRYTFFPVLLAIKSPASLILILGAGAVLAARRRHRLSLPTKVVLFAAAFYLAFALRSRIASSVRHLLPMIPLVCILGGRTLHRLRVRRFAHPNPYRAAGALSVASAAGALLAYPHYLGYFNALCLGERGGHWISSSDDWGQDTRDFGLWVRAQTDMPPLFVGTYTTTEARELASLGVRARPLRCRTKATPRKVWMAAHLNLMTRYPYCYPWLDHARQVGEVDYHLRIYEVMDPEGPVPPPEPPPLDGGRRVPRGPVAPPPPVAPPAPPTPEDEVDGGEEADGASPEDPEEVERR